MLIGLLAVIGLGQWGWQWWKTRPFSAEQLAGVRFKIERMEGKFLPQTLVLAYDVRSLGIDSVTVDFSSAGREYNHHPGDLDRIIKQEPYGRFVYPFWKPADCIIRLIAREQVVATLRHTTQTDGWIGWTADPINGTTQALPQRQIQNAGQLHVPASARRGQSGDYYSHLVCQHPFNLDADEMDWQVRLKNPFNEGGISCFEPAISAQWGGGEQQLLTMQTSRPGCGAGTFIKFGDTLLRNGEHDLSRLSTDFESWHTLRIVTKNRVAQFFVDGQLAFRYAYSDNLALIQSLHIAFKGSGSVDWVRLANSRTGQVLYQNDF